MCTCVCVCVCVCLWPCDVLRQVLAHLTVKERCLRGLAGVQVLEGPLLGLPVLEAN